MNHFPSFIVFGQRLSREFDVVIDVLDVITVVEHVQEFLEHGQVLGAEGLVDLREERDFFDIEFGVGKSLQNGRFGFVELAGRGEDRQRAVFVFDFFDVDVGSDQSFEHRLVVVSLEGEDGQVVEVAGHGAGLLHLGVGLCEAVADFGDRAVVVVGQAIDDDHRVARAEPFVAGRDEIFAAYAFGFFDGFFDNVRGDLILFGSIDHRPQDGIGIRVGDAVFGGNVQLLAILGIDLGLLARGLHDRMLAILEISSHCTSFRERVGNRSAV
jgi:hypothetical protein